LNFHHPTFYWVCRTYRGTADLCGTVLRDALDFSHEAAGDCQEPVRTGEIVVTARRFVAVVVAVLAASCGSARAASPHTITLTLVRHAQSAGNVSGLIDTSTPGPELTAKGWCQATLAVGQLAPNHYDGIYASSMIRTQQTATPTAQALGEPVNVLPGLREIEAGQYEGTPDSNMAQTYFAALQRWLHGDRSARIPGSVDGNEFDARFDDAVQHIYDSGELNPVAFSHSAAIMLWVLMNVRNPDLSLLTGKPLPNVGHVVVTGNPSDGWTLIEWDADPPPC
jgi:broad specificity phosphatase PhoE